MCGVKKIDWGAKVLTYRQIAKGQSLLLSNISQNGEMPAGHRVPASFHHRPVAFNKGVAQTRPGRARKSSTKGGNKRPVVRVTNQDFSNPAQGVINVMKGPMTPMRAAAYTGQKPGKQA